MKSVYTSGFVLFLFLSSFVSGQNYCTPDYLNTGSNSTSIHEVNLGDLRDTAVTAHRLLQYLDYSSAVSVDTQYYLVTTELIRGKNQTLKVSSGVTGCAFSAWIDYDGNGEFDDQDEKLGIAYCPNTEGQIQFHIPAWVTPGDKRLRVSLANSTVNLGRRIDFLPCTPLDPATGQTIDYTVEIHADYCFPTLTSACDTSFMIDGFELNTTRNLNTGKDLAACHSDFTNDPALLTELIRTVSDSLKIHLKNLIAPAAFVNMWIDADDDGEYENYESPLSNLSIPVLTTLDTILSFPVFPIPNETGYKRLRVQVTNTSITNGYEDEACNPFAAGEYEDYLIYIGNSVCTPANSGAAVNGAYVNSVTMDATPASSNTGGNLHYKDYYYTPASFINLTPDKNHSLTVQTVNSTGNTVYVQAFADFNNDGFFDTESPYENLVYNFNGQKYISHQSATALDVITFRSPSVLTEGPIHLRVLVADSTEDFYCGQANPMIAGEI
ncbi:MAG TPA: GEVED domain-containing protein, partial [Bacteroidia bacterium]|nr:GEVED domain-containing protein [Bacteroidia bacterium]